MVSQIVDLGFQHLALGQLQLEAVFLEVIEDHLHSMQMLFRHLREDYDIIQIDEAIGEVQFTQAVLHELLESRWGITQPKRHTFALIQTHAAQSKGSILLGFFIHGNLPKPRIEIKSRIMGSSS